MRHNFVFKILTLALIVLTVVSIGCVRRKDARVVREMRSRSIEQVFDSNRDSLLSIPGVVGAGIAKLDEKPCIMVMVRTRSDSLSSRIPKEIDGYRVVIEETGEFRALDGR